MDTVDEGTQALTEWREVTVRELVEKFNVIDVQRDFILVSERGGVQLANTPNIDQNLAIQELGYTSMSPWTAWTREERIPELRDKQGIRKYYDMKRNDGSVRGSLNLMKTPVRAAHWYVEPASDSTLDQTIADFVEDNLFNGLNVDWNQVLDDVLLMCEYGYMVFEKVYTFNQDGKMVLQKLGPRHPLDIQEWIFDNNGGPAGLVMDPFVPYGNVDQGGFYQTNLPNSYDQYNGFTTGFQPGKLFIPIRKLVIFSFEPEAGDLRGTPILRSAYKHWYYKDTLYKIDAIQKERHGIGVPVIKLPPGFTSDDKKLADELGRNLRTNDRAHIVIPSNWEIMFAKLEGQPVSAIESINHHNEMIQVNILAPFMNAPNADEKSHDMFFKSVRYLANSIANIFNKHVIEQLVDLNFKRGKYPHLRARRISEWDDLRTLSFAARNFVGAGLITPDDVLEEQIRQEADLPPMDKATSRVLTGQPLLQVPDLQNQITEPGGPNAIQDANVPKPPTPGRAGLPRQAPLPPGGLNRPNAGRDGSGG